MRSENLKKLPALPAGSILQEKIPTIPLVTERLYTVDQEPKEFIQNDQNKRNKRNAVIFARIL